MEKVYRNIDIDQEVKDFIQNHKGDFRLCTTCSGPTILPISMKKPKESDIVIQMTPENKLYISKIQAHYLKRIDQYMLSYYRRSLKYDLFDLDQ